MAVNVLIHYLGFNVDSAYATVIFVKFTPRLFEGISL